VTRERILSTLRYRDYPEWTDRVEIFEREGLALPSFLRRLLAQARAYPVVVLTGTWRADQIAAMLIARMRSPPRIVMTDASWRRGLSALERAARTAGVRAMHGRHMTFCVLSRWELERFPEKWGVPADSVRFTPFCFTLPEHELDRPIRDDGGVFVGGGVRRGRKRDPLRDYRSLIEAAPRVGAPITIASNELDSVAMPPNVRAGLVSRERFAELLRQASVVVVPIRAGVDRSAGQQTYLNAMALGKPVIVTDTPGVRDYIEDRETGLIVPPGNTEALAETIRWALDPSNRADVARIRIRAREVARSRFSRRDYIAHVLRVANEQPAARRSARSR
jgi:glycosyltransferase involved in cell wall biosynthesis